VKGVTNSITIDNPVEPEDVSQKITNALTRNARIDAHQVKVKTSGHTVILDGSVRSVAERDEAEMAAWIVLVCVIHLDERPEGLDPSDQGQDVERSVARRH
jgi:osmotically-inducible protein OsmY